MIAASALILLAEAAASCALPGSDRLGGGATIVRPVGTFERIPFERLGPAASVHGDGGKIHQDRNARRRTRSLTPIGRRSSVRPSQPRSFEVGLIYSG